MPNGLRLLSLVSLLSTIACAGTPPATSDAPLPTAIAATSEVTASAAPVTSAAPVAEATLGEVVFTRVGTVPLGAELYAIDGTLVALDIRMQPEKFAFEAFVYELAGDKFTIVGGSGFTGLSQIEDVVGKAGGAITLVSVSPYGRGGIRAETPLRGGGRYREVGDPMSMAFAKAAELEVPSCGGSVGANKLLPMKRTRDWLEDGDAVLIEGESCEGKRSVQVRGSLAATPTIRELAARQQLASGNRGFYLIGDRVERHRAGSFEMIAEQVPAALDNKDGRASAHVYELASDTLIAKGDTQAFLWRSGKWVEALLPGRVSVPTILWDGKVLWATALDKKANGSALYKLTLPGAAVPGQIDTTALKDIGAEPDAPTSPPLAMKAPGPKCASNVVVLYGFTKVTPLDYDYPLTRKALKGHVELKGTRFAVTEDGGKRYFVAFPPSFKSAQELVKVVSAGVNGSKPQVVCAEPKVIRQIEIDLATGEIK